MTEYVFPAIFHRNDNDGSFTVTYPDLPGCITEGKSIGNAMYMAEDALTQWIEYSIEKKLNIPSASLPQNIEIEDEDKDFLNLIRADIKDGRAVKRTVSIPKWMDDCVIENGISLSRVLQEALKRQLHVG